MTFNEPPWVPIRDPRMLKMLGKLAEELGEASAIVARSIIQGVDGSNPKTGKINRDALQEELCDVLALICVTSHELSMSALVMRERIEMKKEMFESWALFDPPP